MPFCAFPWRCLSKPHSVRLLSKALRQCWSALPDLWTSVHSTACCLLPTCAGAINITTLASSSPPSTVTYLLSPTFRLSPRSRVPSFGFRATSSSGLSLPSQSYCVTATAVPSMPGIRTPFSLAWNQFLSQVTAFLFLSFKWGFTMQPRLVSNV